MLDLAQSAPRGVHNLDRGSASPPARTPPEHPDPAPASAQVRHRRNASPQVSKLRARSTPKRGPSQGRGEDREDVTVREDPQRRERGRRGPTRTGTESGRVEGLRVTNIEAALMPAAEEIGSYHDLWNVERSFRMCKTDLAARPIFTTPAMRSRPISPSCSPPSRSPATTERHGLEHQEDRPEPAATPRDHRPHRRPPTRGRRLDHPSRWRDPRRTRHQPSVTPRSHESGGFNWSKKPSPTSHGLRGHVREAAPAGGLGDPRVFAL